MNYRPPFAITSKIINRISVISEQVGRINMDILNRSPRLRKKNRIKTIKGTLAIEGNALTIEQVTAIVDGKHIFGPQKEIAEVHGAIKAYEALPGLDYSNKRDLLRAHKIMMGDTMKDAGQFRQKAVGIHKGDKIVHIAPQAHRVPLLMDELLAWCKNSDHHPLIVSCVFHYELEFIRSLTAMDDWDDFGKP